MAGREPPMSNKADYDLPEGAKPLKTWSFLSHKKRRPSEYEVVSTRLFYTRDHPGRPWAIGKNQPLNVWYRENLQETPLQHDSWEEFRDPDEITYRAYNIVQDGQESYVDGLLEHYAKLGDDAVYPEEWVKVLAALYTPGRYVLHTVQMVASYLSILTPASTIGLCSAFQAADQLRWISRIAYRTAELAEHRPGFGFGEQERSHWEEDPAWQGFRELMEKLLATYDWSEAITVLCLVAKPAVEEAFFRQFGRVARSESDTLFGLLAEAALRDCDRSRRWTTALVQFLQEKEGNQELMEAWIAKWTPLADAAIEAFCAGLPDGAEAARTAKHDAQTFRKGLGFPS